MDAKPITARVKSYMFVRDRREDGIEWVRAAAFDPTDLPRPLILLNGCFDILHSGHMKLLFQARDRCKTLVVAMDSDRRVREGKGPGRPVLGWIERATALGYFPIDYLVEIDSNIEMRDFINRVRPDFRVQGAEYADQASQYPWLRKIFVRSEGMRTSYIIERIEQAYEQKRTG